MTDQPVVELSEAEYRRVWDRFYAEFGFRPSMNSAMWPAIKEPDASVTWSLGALDDDPDYELLDRLVEVVEQGLRAVCVPPQGGLFALDWHHASYRFSPHLVGGPEQAQWPLSPYPDGDYYIYLSEDFRTGSFGHPWEFSLCLFGQEFLSLVEASVDEILGTPIRRSGRPVPRT
ncbi:DUF2716 domain-containing protein [Actinacidiphila acididurans]|uniref:DUF2716 domain-containing protein n=1 Tax=Actinacidiphila acididurans TaxID=2784346 RepID=A0ABS2TL45_9ACTN|nr:DUF2716 domain-containing protein [Actinacidiphila acididurans]MBM9504066.1 DUF2716 domain-containing protein [Actinacidiphila acididurans]